MYEYILKRLVLAVPTLIGVTLLVSAIIRMLPGDVVLAMMAESGNISVGGVIDQKALAQFRAQLGLDKPFHVWYVTWLWKVVHGDFGESLYTGQPVWSEIQRRWPVSFQLAIMAMLISIIIAIPVGVVSAIRQDSRIDYILRFLAILGLAMPGFWVALMVIVLLITLFQWIPSVYYAHLWDDPVQNLKVLWLPALLVGSRSTAEILRMTRSSVLEVLHEDYVRTAHSKGLASRRVLAVHVLRNALLPVTTLAGFEVVFAMSGQIITEQIFNLPGVGKLFIQSVAARDYPVIQAIVMFIAFVVLLANLTVDIMYAWLDPRIRYS